MPEETIQVQGMETLLERLGNMESLVTQKNILVRSLRKGGEVIAEEAARLAPRDTGRLSTEMVVVVSEQTADHAIARIGPSKRGFYGLFQELGTARQRTKHAFLQPAWDAKIDEAQRVIGEELDAGITKATR